MLLSRGEVRRGRYDGEWLEGSFHGAGTFWYACGDIYTGEFVHGAQARTPSRPALFRPPSNKIQLSMADGLPGRA